MIKYKIKWKSLITDESGESEPEFSKILADEIVKDFNVKKAGEIHHWAEPVEVGEE